VQPAAFRDIPRVAFDVTPQTVEVNGVAEWQLRERWLRLRGVRILKRTIDAVRRSRTALEGADVD
jgi:hypothetical protein